MFFFKKSKRKSQHHLPRSPPAQVLVGCISLGSSKTSQVSARAWLLSTFFSAFCLLFLKRPLKKEEEKFDLCLEYVYWVA